VCLSTARAVLALCSVCWGLWAGEAAAEYSLVILDPGMPAHELLGSLRYEED
jgi:hypothetical protein